MIRAYIIQWFQFIIQCFVFEIWQWLKLWISKNIVNIGLKIYLTQKISLFFTSYLSITNAHFFCNFDSSYITNLLPVAIGPWSSQLPLDASCLLIDSNLRFSKFHFVTLIYDRKMPSYIYLQLYHCYCYGHVTYLIVKNTQICDILKVVNYSLDKRLLCKCEKNS